MTDGDTFLDLMKRARDRGASDLILVAGSPPVVYVDGQMQPMDGEPFAAGALQQVILTALSERQRQRLVIDRDLDFSLGHADAGRCRVNVHYQRASLAVAIRFVPSVVPDLNDLNLPPVVQQFVTYPRGLVLVTGGTGEGKSTTLAALIERINVKRGLHVITLEDPIEYAFRNKKCVIEQREIGDDSPSFAAALRHVVRQKPDVILVGEMRDLETISTALTAAETGHLVLASLHTISAAQTIERIVDVFDARQQPQVRVQLAGTLRAILCQTLLGNQRDGGLVPACEVLIITPGISRAIRENNVHLINGMIETGSQCGMQTLDGTIATLVREGMVSEEQALSKAADADRLAKLLRRAGPSSDPVAVGGGTRKPWE